MHHQTSRPQLTVFIGLGSFQDENVFKTKVFVQGDPSAGFKANKSGCRSMRPIAVQPMDMDTRVQDLPVQGVWNTQQFIKILKNE
jgi:hypothetical protein